MENNDNNQGFDSSWGEIIKKPEATPIAKPIQPEPSVSVPRPTSPQNKPIQDIFEKPQKPTQQPQPEIIAQPTQEELHKAKTPLWKLILRGVLIFVGTFIFIYLFLTFPAQWQKIKYFFSHIGSKNQPQKIEVPVSIEQSGSDLFLSTVKDALDKAPDKKTSQATNKPKSSLDISDLEDNMLLIPKTSVRAPIVWESPPDEDIMLKNLQDGVVQYKGTGLPDEADGNVFISGHSSYYWWDKGGYKTVFATLDNLTQGDELAIAYQGKVYFYKVYEKIEVSPNDVGVLEPVGKPIVSLMTCVPVGTNLRRLIVRAERIDVASKETPKTSETTPSPTISSSPTTTSASPTVTLSPTPTSISSPISTPQSSPTSTIPDFFLWEIVSWID